jgi:hypothetical protein
MISMYLDDTYGALEMKLILVVKSSVSKNVAVQENCLLCFRSSKKLLKVNKLREMLSILREVMLNSSSIFRSTERILKSSVSILSDPCQ